MEPRSTHRHDHSVVSMFSDGLRLVRRAWPQFAAADIATRVATTLFLTPVVAWAARGALDRAGGGALTDADILWFVLSPLGFATLLLVAAGAVVSGLFGHTVMMTIAAGIEHDRAVSWLAGMRHATNRLSGLLELAVRGLVRLLIDASPWLVAGATVYLIALTDHDINYYLTEKPPRFLVSGALIGTMLIGLAWSVGRRLLGWAIALPRLLFGGTSPAGALAASAAVTEGKNLRVLLLLAVWAASTLAFAALVTGAAGWTGRLLIPEGGEALARTAAGIGIASVIAFIGNLIVSVASSIALAVSLFALDRAWAEPWILPREVTAATGRLGSRATLAVPGRVWILAAVAVPVAALFLGIEVLEDLAVEDSVQITAHRGASGRAPENTLAAIRAAIADGADWVEIDVQETSDGVVVVHHDEDFMRASGNPGKIWELPWSDVSRIPNGAWYGVEFEAERVASLEEVLQLTRDRIRVNVELKVYGRGRQLEERTIEIVERLGMVDQVALMSLDRPTVEKLRNLRPEWTVGLLATVSVGDLTKLDADFLAVNARNATPGFVRRVHASGKELLVWTVNHPAQMSSMISLGVDGIITDEPALAFDVLAQRATMTPVERLLVSIGAQVGIVEGADETSAEDDA